MLTRWTAVVGALAVSLVVGASSRAQGSGDGLLFSEKFTGDVSRWSCPAGAWAVTDGPKGEKVATLQPGDKTRIRATIPLGSLKPTGIRVAYRGRRESRDVFANVELGLTVKLDDGSTVGFEKGLKLDARNDAERWAQKESVYLAPSGRRIAGVEIQCYNYRAEKPTSFADIMLWNYAPPPPPEGIAVIRFPGEEGKLFDATLDAVKKSGLKFDVVPPYADLSKARMIVIADFPNDEDFCRQLRLACFMGGRVLIRNLTGDAPSASAAQYFWDKPDVAALKGEPVVNESGRAVYLPENQELTPQRIEGLWKTEVRLPDVAPALPGPYPPKPRWTLRGDALLKDGRPFLFRGSGADMETAWLPPDRRKHRVEMWAHLGLSATILYVRPDSNEQDIVAFLDLCQANGIAALVYNLSGLRPYDDRPLKDEWILKMLRLRNHPAVIGWELCDDGHDEYYPFVKRASDLFRRYDPHGLQAATFLDYRKADLVAREEWAKWTKLTDFPLPYIYCVERDAETFPGGGMGFGLEDIQRLSEATHSVWGADAYVMQWVQAHMQNDAFGATGLVRTAMFLPSPEQERLLTFMALSSDTRGISYFATYSLVDDKMGAGRRNEIGLVWRSLAPVEETLAGGKWARQPTREDGIETAEFSNPEETVALVLRHGKLFHRCVDAQPSDVTVRIPWSAAGLPVAVRLSPLAEGAEVRRADGKTIELTLKGFDLAEGVLLAGGELKAEAVRQALKRNARGDAELAIAVAFDKRIKTELVCELLGARVPDDFKAALQQGGEAADLSQSLYAQGRYAESYAAARKAVLPYRRVQGGLLARATEYAGKKKVSAQVFKKTGIFGSLPGFYAAVEGSKFDAAEMAKEYLRRWTALDLPGKEWTVGAETVSGR